MNLENIKHQTQPINEFELISRFTEERYNILPKNHLSKIKPLNKNAYKKLGDYLFEESGLMGHFKLNEEHFRSIDELDFRELEDKRVNEWLENLNIKNSETVFAYWNSWGCVYTKWEIIKLYYDDFYYPVSDDLILTNQKINWIIYFFHEKIAYFGLRK